MSDDQIRVLVYSILSAGCGTALTYLINKIQQWYVDNGNPLSPKALRRISMALSVVVPLVLYFITWVAGWNNFDWLQAAWYVGDAFLVNQGAHGETQLSDAPKAA